ncbi:MULTISPECIES: hypothetical protein [Lactobacillus]|uniref:Uncharacterized protein n=2 Tax=Lactobacillus TaxID=1578 RepID=A0A256LCF3_9LACO|nr:MULTISPECIES: hypothetical protein [Lactobacillus]KXN76891.1 hypothetical protein AYJ53_07445 [Lactobacillus johnsonii]OYR87349.1 hypothetical protein CBF53_07825 [Lactobacillus taiwanensis]OYR90970.1 hypothetical protein CBF70_07270 [Lactobacillus taiwanensis]
MKLIYSKNTHRYILIAPMNFNFESFTDFKSKFAKLNNIPDNRLIILPKENLNCIDISDGYVEV